MDFNNLMNPYPEIRVEGQNIEYAKILLQDYAGEISEDTAIHLYTYQKFLEEAGWEEYAQILEAIARVEVFHLEVLGRLIFLLGLNPIYATINAENNTPVYWTSEYVDYTDELKKMLEADIKAESLTIEQYELHKQIINDKYIKEILDIIIQDEKAHLNVFEDLYGRLPNRE